jgi:hypothetical protein
MLKKIYFPIIILIFLIITSTIGCLENTEKNDIVLTVSFDDYIKEYSLNDLESIESYSDSGRYIKTKLLPELVEISDSVYYTGVKIVTIFDDIPDLPDNYNAIFTSSDNWTIAFTKDEIEGDVNVYGENGIISLNETAVMILAYKEKDMYYSEIDPEGEIGPLRIAFVKDDVITASNIWSKMVVSIDIVSV